MKKHWLLFIIIAFIFKGCSKPIIPEISPYLYDENILDLTAKQLSGTLIENNSQLVFITLEGEIFRWDPQSHIINSLIHLNSKIDGNPYFQNNFLLIKQSTSNQYSILNIDEMKEIAVLKDISIQKIIGLNHEILVYLSNPRELIIYNYRAQKILESIKIKGKQKVFNADFKDGQIIILTRNFIHFYNTINPSLESKKLKHKANSEFLLDGSVIYYGSNNRELVKFSLNSHKPSWSFKIAEQLSIKPLKINKYIAIIPEDNNIYFFNNKGTLYWWEKLNSTMLIPPISMKENIIVFLWDKTIKFFNYKKKQVTSYTLNQTIATNPVDINEYLYVVTEEPRDDNTEDDSPLFSLSKIGNNYGIKITTKPLHVKSLNKSIRFDLKSFNLIKPQYKIKIFKNQEESHEVVFEKKLSFDEKPSFIWIPKEPIQYKLIIEISAENKEEIKVEQTFTAIDIEKMLKLYYYQMQINCKSNSF